MGRALPAVSSEMRSQLDFFLSECMIRKIFIEMQMGDICSDSVCRS